MSLIETKRGNYQKALEHKNLYANYLDSIHEMETEQSVMEYQKRYDYTQVKAEKDRLEILNKQKTITLLILVVIVLLILIIAGFSFTRYKRIVQEKIKKRDKMLENSIALISKKKEELIEKENIFRSKLIDQGTELEQLRFQQQKFKEQFFRMNDVVKKIESIRSLNDLAKVKTKSSLALSDNDLSNLMDAINICYDGFTDRLLAQFPELKAPDIQLCTPIKMGVENKDITFLLNISSSALKKRKYRLRAEKLNLAEDAALDDFIRNY